MEFAAICLRNALLLLPEDQQDPKQENGSKNSNQLGGNAESGESSDACRYPDRFDLPRPGLQGFVSQLCPVDEFLKSAARISKVFCFQW